MWRGRVLMEKVERTRKREILRGREDDDANDERGEGVIARDPSSLLEGA